MFSLQRFSRYGDFCGSCPRSPLWRSFIRFLAPGPMLFQCSFAVGFLFLVGLSLQASFQICSWLKSCFVIFLHFLFLRSSTQRCCMRWCIVLYCCLQYGHLYVRVWSACGMCSYRFIFWSVISVCCSWFISHHVCLFSFFFIAHRHNPAIICFVMPIFRQSSSADSMSYWVCFFSCPSVDREIFFSR